MKGLFCLAAIAGAVLISAAGAAENYQNWAYYRTIVLNTKASGANVGTAGSPAITHFPVLVRLSGKGKNGGNANDSIVMAQSAFSASNGQDIRFSKWDGAHLYFQRQRWDATNLYAEFWVLVDTVWGQDSVNAANYPGGYLKMYWGKSGAGDSANGPAVFDTTRTPPAGTPGTMWGGGYQAVYHLTDTTDATWNGKTFPQYYNLTRGSTYFIKTTTGMVGQADTLTGSYGSWLAAATKSASPDKLNFQNGGPYTLSAWVYPTKISASGGGNAIMGSGDYAFELLLNGSGSWELGDYAIGTGWFCQNANAPAANAWYHVVGVRNNIGSSPAYTDSLYVNDVLVSTTMSSSASTVARPSTDPNFCIGSDTSSLYKEWYGIINEAELSGVPRGHAWVRLCWENQHQINALGVQAIGAALDSLTIRGADFYNSTAFTSYSANPATYTTGIEITPNSPTVTGPSPDTFAVSPPLPAGLTINVSTGVIGGTASSSAAQQSYTVTVRNGAGSASIGLTITVNNAPPAITGQPVTSTVVEGANAKFIVTVSGTPPMQYAWKDNNGNIVKQDTTMNFSDTLTIPNDSAKNYGASYTCTITNIMSTAGPSAAAYLYVAAAPTLASPINSAAGVSLSPTLSWNTAAGAASYILQISTSSQFGTSGGASIDSESVIAPPRTITVTLHNGAAYYWRVQSRVNGIASLWSNSGGSPWQFTTVAAAPALSSPVNTSVEVPVNPTLTWNTIAAATKYWIQITTDGTFTAIGTNDSTTPTLGGTYSASGLTNGTTYYWRAAVAASGGAWSAWSAPWSFYTTENYAGWSGSRTFGLNTKSGGANVAKTQYGFPVLLRLSSADVANMTGVQSNGSDVRFTKLDGVTHFPYQIESFGPGGAVIWVKMDSVQGGSNNGGFIMKWGSSGVPSISRGSLVFDTTAANPGGGYQAVWHMMDTTDATINGYRLVSTSATKPAAITAVTPVIGTSGYAFNGTSNYFQTDSLSTVHGKLDFPYGGPFTISAWSYITTLSHSEMVSKSDYQYALQTPSSPRPWEIAEYDNGVGTFWARPGNNAGIAAGTGAWHHIVGVVANGGAAESLYVDGAVGGDSVGLSASTSSRDNSHPVSIGKEGDASARYWAGYLDEVEMANVARSSAWVHLSYENQQPADSLTYRTAPASVTYRSSALNLTTTTALTPDTPYAVTGVVSQYSVSPPLPPGLSLDPVAGVISGTPSAAAGATAYVITAGNPIGSVTTGVTIRVTAPPTGFAYATNPVVYALNAPIAADTVSITNSVDSFTVSAMLPAGLSLNKTTGALTGTPTATQTAMAYTVTAKNAAGTATVALTITVFAATPPSGLSYSVSNATYVQNVVISADTATLAAGIADSFTISPALPAGLSLDKTMGTISGTPTTGQAAAAYTVTARNAGGSASASITIQVNGAPSVLAYSINPATCWLGVAIATDSAILTGVADSFSVSPALPSGLSLNTTTGSVTGTPGASQAASAYTVIAWNPAGSASVSLSITVNGPPSAPVLEFPIDNASTAASMPKLSWNTAASAFSYHVQLSTNAPFISPVVDSSLAGASDSIVRALSGGVQYYWRVAATNPAGSSGWALDSFTVMPNIAIPVRAGWSLVSLNVHAQDSLAADVMGTLKGFVLAKTLTQVYWPAYGIDGIDTMGVTRGYQMYSDSADTIKAAGPAVNVSATPIPLSMGWNLISYLPQTPMSVDSAVADVDSQIVLVKDQNGYVYWPEDELNGIGDLNVGQGYQFYMSTYAVLTYPATAAQAKRFAGMIHKSAALPKPRHFACALNTGSSATVLSKRTTINGAAAHDSCEIGVYDGKGDLVGSGVVVHGAAAFSVWGKSGLKKGTAAGCESGEKLTFRLWDGAQENPLEFHGTMQPQYANNAILTGSMVVPSRLFISKFALSRAYPNPFRENIRIFFDVPVVAGKELQDVEISVYDLNGSVVRQLANGKYAAGHYSVSWDGAGQSALGSNMYIVEMKASQFTQRLKLFRVK